MLLTETFVHAWVLLHRDGFKHSLPGIYLAPFWLALRTSCFRCKKEDVATEIMS